MKRFGIAAALAGSVAFASAGLAAADPGLPLEPAAAHQSATDGRPVADLSPSGSANSLASGSATLSCWLAGKTIFCGSAG
ncbi:MULTISPECIES: hypothetical protein [unclassified Nocardia]|uniref:hypothetical protein n=1 Tax=unclassified Nocardia TaxID=2637762 RepID=UPI001CE42AD9|nr:MULTISPECIES: hypothetical protein [unclassified Nocardia]